MSRPRLFSRCVALMAACAFVTAHARLASAEALASNADRVVVIKSERVLELMHEGQILKTYPIALGRHPKGAKSRRGDGRTPEGVYVIDRRSTHTIFRRELHISYPNDDDQARAEAAHVRAGDGIFIHGMPPRFGHTDPVSFFRDWTDGCIAVGNIAIEEIWDAVADGTPIEIRP